MLHNFPNIDIGFGDDAKEVPVFSSSDRSVLIRIMNRGVVDADKVVVTTHHSKCTTNFCPGCAERRNTTTNGQEAPESHMYR